MLWLGLISGLVELAGAAFLLSLLAAGVLQDADQWGQHSHQMLTHISLLTVGGGVGVLAGTIALWWPQSIPLEKRWTWVIGILVAAVVTVVSIPFGWDYWLKFASNIPFFVVMILSASSFVIYLTTGTIQIGRWRESGAQLSS